MPPENEEIRFECTKCGACCCEDSLLVTVTGRDIARISFSLGLNANEVLRALDFYLVSGTESPVGFRDIPTVNTEQGRAYVAIKKMENGDCIFLKDNLCMIHLVRPMVCKSFPFVFRDNDGDQTWGLSAMKEICPGLGTGPVVDLSELRELAVTVLEDLTLYRKFTEEWNSEKNPTVKDLIEKILLDTRFSV
ncbi:MAG: YkgJ family cysteine cluster protein [Candidatus Thorarchaeota archaeon]